MTIFLLSKSGLGGRAPTPRCVVGARFGVPQEIEFRSGRDSGRVENDFSFFSPAPVRTARSVVCDPGFPLPIPLRLGRRGLKSAGTFRCFPRVQSLAVTRAADPFLFAAQGSAS